MDYSWETLKIIIEDFKEQYPDQFHGSVYETFQKEMLKKEKDWQEEEENERKKTNLTAVKENIGEAILNSKKSLNALNVTKTKKRVKQVKIVVKGGNKRVLKRKQNTRGKKGSFWVAGRGNNRSGEEKEKRQGEKKRGGRQGKERHKKWMQWGGLLHNNPIILFSAHKDTG
uniref:Uncharacterized protein n=1 Tax=Micrurus spixii TaxID=129469 RepID=A0A2D4M1H8_9SAUR